MGALSVGALGEFSQAKKDYLKGILKSGVIHLTPEEEYSGEENHSFEDPAKYAYRFADSQRKKEPKATKREPKASASCLSMNFFHNKEKERYSNKGSRRVGVAKVKGLNGSNFAFDPDEMRVKRLQNHVHTFVATVKRLAKVYPSEFTTSMVTLTYEKKKEYTAEDISKFTKAVKRDIQKECGKDILTLCSFLSVMEPHKSKKPHYHVLIHHPVAFKITNPRKWKKHKYWANGWLNVKANFENPFYMISYLKKGHSKNLKPPRNARICTLVTPTTDRMRLAKKLNALPSWLKDKIGFAFCEESEGGFKVHDFINEEVEKGIYRICDGVLIGCYFFETPFKFLEAFYEEIPSPPDG